MSIRIRYFAAAKAALGVGEEQREAAGDTIDALMRELAAGAPDADAATAVLDRCSFILNRHATTDRATVLHDGDELDVLPPFAGG
ncbi:MoaD/ThiS family protein [Herbiconiux ginsengi]|uniref:Molybdopterin synthase sulfur carrier subunit n=1 Tax=Herbiconiux ginsengi TaxID=381665 RepID=A0A1H3S9Z3_9MICO|nr:MoaD/ThiS family protein [Herbiconiux ginsengi]SDZ34822.1 Molybdopterin converting factor, small subunit [Herbiconiux ginsengi]